MLADHFRLLAAYNAAMNEKAYAAAASLPPEALHAERGAFFGSIFGTLHHIAVADRIWLRRFAAHPARFAALEPILALPAVTSLDTVLATEFADLQSQRTALDAIITAFAAQLKADDLAHVLHHSNSKGQQFDRLFASLILHFFNHQTHHRGQASTLLLQAGVDIGVTDLLALIPSQSA
jgi:uncharacterized damage-inducible protein DinB